MTFEEALALATKRRAVLVNEDADVEVDFADPENVVGEVPGSAMLMDDWNVEMRDRKINIKDIDKATDRISRECGIKNSRNAVYDILCKELGFML